MEILEELDDNDNVLSSKLSTPGEAAAHLSSLLGKDGLAEPREEEGQNSLSITPERAGGASTKKSGVLDQLESPEQPSVDGDFPAPRDFPEDKVHDLSARLTTSSQEQPSANEDATALPRREISVLQTPSTQPMPPDEESAEEAQLRREMLEYSTNEVGAIVAEMDLEEDVATDTSDREGEEDIDEETDSEDEDEDEEGSGAIRGKLISDDYRRQMLELERKLNARALVNIGPKEREAGPAIDGAEARRSHPRDEPESAPAEKSAERKPKKAGKGVRFASELDIQEAPMPGSAVGGVDASNDPVSAAVIERRPPASSDSQKSGAGLAANVTPPNSGALPIRSNRKLPTTDFRPAKQQQQPDAVSTKLDGKTHGDVLERASRPPTQEVPEPDELDPSLIRREVAMGYQRQRNRMIERNGGFMNDLDEDEIPVDETGRKMSRFKAARLSRVPM